MKQHGNINGDKTVNIADVVALKKRFKKWLLNDKFFHNFDADSDGNGFTNYVENYIFLDENDKPIYNRLILDSNKNGKNGKNDEGENYNNFINLNLKK
jgi:hypothetical protein